MYAAATRSMTFEKFLEWYPEDGRRYEPFDGEVVEMRFKIKKGGYVLPSLCEECQAPEIYYQRYYSLIA